MTIALPATIKSMWAVVLMPHLTRCGFDIVVVVTALSCAVRKLANARAFERHRPPTRRRTRLHPWSRTEGQRC